MKSHSSLFTLAATLLLACGAIAHAQQVYRIVGPDGKVTFSDKAPDKSTPAATVGQSPAAGSATSAPALPYELRQVTARYPVTLYTSNDCAPCANARNLLVNRGVPFNERTVSSNDDIQALQRLSGSNTLPFGTIGGQQLQGFSDAEWTQYLDAAGYPKQSQLPPNYRRPAATPLVAAVARPAPAPAANAPTPAAQPAPAPAGPSGPTPSNPAGITF